VLIDALPQLLASAKQLDATDQERHAKHEATLKNLGIRMQPYHPAFIYTNADKREVENILSTAKTSTNFCKRALGMPVGAPPKPTEGRVGQHKKSKGRRGKDSTERWKKRQMPGVAPSKQPLLSRRKNGGAEKHAQTPRGAGPPTRLGRGHDILL
jgi:hypothetical protein